MKRFSSIIIALLLVVLMAGCTLFPASVESTTDTYLDFTNLVADNPTLFNDSNMLDITFSDAFKIKMQENVEYPANGQADKVKYYEQIISDTSTYSEINYASLLLFSYYYDNLNSSNEATEKDATALYNVYQDFANAVQNLKSAIERLETISLQAGFLINSNMSLSSGGTKELENFKNAYNEQIVANFALANEFIDFLKTYIYGTAETAIPTIMSVMAEQLRLAETVYYTMTSFDESDDVIVDYTYTTNKIVNSEIVSAEVTTSVNFYSGLIGKLATLNTDIQTMLDAIKIGQAQLEPLDLQSIEEDLGVANAYAVFNSRYSEYEMQRDLYLMALDAINTNGISLSDYIENGEISDITSSKIIYTFDYLNNDFIVYYNALENLLNALQGALTAV